MLLGMVQNLSEKDPFSKDTLSYIFVDQLRFSDVEYTLQVNKQKLIFGPDGSYTDVTDNTPFPVIDAAVTGSLSQIDQDLLAFKSANHVDLVAVTASINNLDQDLIAFRTANHTDLVQLDTDLLAFKTANHTDLVAVTGTLTNGTTQVQGNVPSASADSGNPIKIGMIINPDGSLFSNGHRSNAQGDSAASIYVNTTGRLPTYAAASNFTAAATATDVFTITGSASKIIRVRQITVAGTNTGNTNAAIYLLKRSTANSGGTSTSLTLVPYDSLSAAPTAVVRSYTANPTLGTLVGQISSRICFMPALASTNIANTQDFLGARNLQAVTLRGTNEVLAVNLNGIALLGTTVLYISVKWTEE